MRDKLLEKTEGRKITRRQAKTILRITFRIPKNLFRDIIDEMKMMKLVNCESRQAVQVVRVA